MAGLFKGSKKGLIPENLPAELQGILSQMERERKAFELLTVRAAASADQFKKLAGPVAKIENTVDNLGDKLSAFDDLVPQIAAIQQQAEALSQSHRVTEAQVAELAGGTERARSNLRELREPIEQALTLKKDLTGFLELGGPFKALRGEADELGSQLRDFGSNFGRAREEHEQVLRGYKEASVRMDAFDAQYRELHSGVGDAEQRAEKLEQTMKQFEHIAASLPDTKRELSTLKALGDYVTQKISALEQQRGAVDRATIQAAHLSETMKQIDEEVQKQQENTKFFNRIRTSVEELKTAHMKLLDSSEEIRSRQQKIEQEDQAKREELLALRDELQEDMQKTVKRFEFESRGLDSVSERIIEIRGALNDFESRFQSLEDPRRTLADIPSQVERLSSQISAISGEIADVEEHAEKMTVLRQDVEAIEQLVSDVTERIGGIEHPPILRAVEEAEQRIADVDAAVKTLEVRSDDIEALSERMQRAGQELDQRQAAIDSASERLDDASGLSQEAARVLRELEEQGGKLTKALATAGGRTNRLTELVEQLEKRSSEFRFTEKRMSRFEERMANWESAEGQLERALEQVSQRQGSVDALRAEVTRLFEMVERTVEDVRSIADARQEIADNREMLEEIISELDEATEGADALDTKKRQINQAEERLARADALLIDIKSSLEAVSGQKAFLDEVVAKAGSLTFQAKEAEVLIDTLRKERNLTDRFRAAVHEEQEDQQAAAS
jgi:chromosome segregation ATPase